MKTRHKNILSAVLLLISTLGAMAKSDTEALIYKAMEDEMARSMNELTYEEYETPFYVSYFVNNANKCSVKAHLGSLLESTNDNSVFCGYRLMVGSYDLNDEKFNDKVNRVSYNDGGFSSLEYPDYYGIRRSLWLMSNNAYKSASEKYKNKCDMMAKEGLSVDELPAPDFSKEPKVEYIQESYADEKDKAFFEQWAKDISLVFAQYTDVIESSVTVKYINLTTYMLDSEGTKTQIPNRMYTLDVKAKILSKKNRPITEALRYYAKSYDELPKTELIKEDAHNLVKNMYALREAPEYLGKYEGPLLVQDEAVFYKSILPIVRRGNGLLSNPRGLVNDKSKGIGVATYFTWEDMKGKRVLDKKLSFTAVPHLESYEGINLLGTVKCDNDGVLTPATVSLIDNGILKNQLNNRTPTPSQLHSNGHSLPYYKNNGFSTQLGTSVIKVDASEAKPMDSIYIELIALAKEEDLDHAIILKPMQSNANEAPINTYKLDIETGEETLLAGTSYNGEISALKKVKALGNEQILTNALVANQAAMDRQRKKIAKYPDWIKDLLRMQMGAEGSPSSFIYPNAMLFKSATVDGASNSSRTKPRVVPSPLAAR